MVKSSISGPERMRSTSPLSPRCDATRSRPPRAAPLSSCPGRACWSRRGRRVVDLHHRLARAHPRAPVLAAARPLVRRVLAITLPSPGSTTPSFSPAPSTTPSTSSPPRSHPAHRCHDRRQRPHRGLHPAIPYGAIVSVRWLAPGLTLQPDRADPRHRQPRQLRGGPSQGSTCDRDRRWVAHNAGILDPIREAQSAPAVSGERDGCGCGSRTADDSAARRRRPGRPGRQRRPVARVGDPDRATGRASLSNRPLPAMTVGWRAGEHHPSPRETGGRLCAGRLRLVRWPAPSTTTTPTRPRRTR
jgi:hypothetical protein